MGVIHMNGRIHDPELAKIPAGGSVRAERGGRAELEPLQLHVQQAAGVYGSEWISVGGGMGARTLAAVAILVYSGGAAAGSKASSD